MRRFVTLLLISMAAGLMGSLGGCSHIGKTNAEDSPLTRGLDVYEINRINQEARVRNADVIWINPPQRKIQEDDAEQKEERDEP